MTHDQAQMQMTNVVTSLMVVISLFLIVGLYIHEKYNKPKADIKVVRRTETIILILFVLLCLPFATGINFIVHTPINVTNIPWLDAILASFFSYTGLVFMVITVCSFLALFLPIRIRHLIAWMYILYPVIAGLYTWYEVAIFNPKMSASLGFFLPTDYSFYFFIPYVVYLIMTKKPSR